MIRCLFALILAFALHTNASAEPPAGMVLYFESGGEVFLLLAEHAGSQRGWAGFGGGGREGETLAETAAHKAEEESRGYFNRTDLLERIEGQDPVMDGEFAAYFAEIEFVPAQRIMNNPPPETTDTYLERSTFAWIPYSAVEGYVRKDVGRKKYPIDPLYLPAGSETTWFWPAWLGNIRKAVQKNALPWD